MTTALFGATGLLLVGAGVPLWRRKVGPNRLYGFRTPTTLKNERLWYEVNARCGVDLVAVGLGLLVATAAHAAGGLSARVFYLVASIWGTMGALWTAVHGAAFISKWRD